MRFTRRLPKQERGESGLGRVLVLTALTLLVLGSAVSLTRGSASGPAGQTAVAGVTTISDHGGRLDWSHNLDLLAFDRRGPDGYYDVYAIWPDGGGQSCITCDTPGLPRRHVGDPAWHPSGEYIVLQAEKPQHPGSSSGAMPGIGFDNDVWLVNREGTRAWQLTSITNRSAVLHPQFSADGKRLLWTEGVSIAVADFVTAPEPRIENKRLLRPGGWLLHEVHGFSPGAPSKIVLSGPLAGQQITYLDVYTYDLDNGVLKDLTPELNQWDGRAHYSPSGEKIAWASSLDCDCNPGALGRLQTDIWIMNPDGSNKQRLTHFSDPASQNHKGQRVVVSDLAWSADGKRLAAVLRVDSREQIAMVEFTTPQ